VTILFQLDNGAAIVDFTFVVHKHKENKYILLLSASVIFHVKRLLDSFEMLTHFSEN